MGHDRESKSHVHGHEHEDEDEHEHEHEDERILAEFLDVQPQLHNGH